MFGELTAANREEAVRFMSLYRQTALSLGRLAKSAGLLAQLANSVNAARIAPDLELTTQAREAGRVPNPHALLLDAGLKPALGSGWNWVLQLCPLYEEAENE